jgi:hypothetical protein
MLLSKSLHMVKSSASAVKMARALVSGRPLVHKRVDGGLQCAWCGRDVRSQVVGRVEVWLFRPQNAYMIGVLVEGRYIFCTGEEIVS